METFEPIQEDLMDIFQELDDSGFEVDLSMNPKKNKNIFAYIFKRNESQFIKFGYYENFDGDKIISNEFDDTPDNIIKDINPIDSKIYNLILEAFDRTKDQRIEEKTFGELYNFKISIGTRYFKNQFQEGRVLNSVLRTTLIREYKDNFPPRPNRLNVCSKVWIEIHRKPDPNSPSLIKKFQNFFK